MMSRAPKGGVVSVVNGQRYEGGEFTPDHGLYCGKGKNRVSVAEFAAVAAKAQAAGKELSYSEATGDFVVKYPVCLSDKTVVSQVMFKARSLKTVAKCF